MSIPHVIVIGAGSTAGGPAASAAPSFESSLGLDAVRAAQAGLVADMDYVADALYGRAGATPST